MFFSNTEGVHSARYTLPELAGRVHRVYDTCLPVFMDACPPVNTARNHGP